jgi:hypothetical protein
VSGAGTTQFARSRRTVKAAIEVGQRFDPARWLATSPAGAISTVGFVSIYRRRNAALVCGLLQQLPEQASVRLWALDEPDERLRTWTIGTGPGGRLDLLNELVSSIGETCDVLVRADDDIRFVAGDVTALLRVGRAMGLDVFQPSHSRLSHCAYKFTQKRWLVSARRTTFVEQGPMVVMSAAAQRELLPLPADFGMGWGVEVQWWEASDRLRLGVVDAVAVRHDGGPGHGYDVEPERRRLQGELARVGATDLGDLQHEVERYRPLLRRWHRDDHVSFQDVEPHEA